MDSQVKSAIEVLQEFKKQSKKEVLLEHDEKLLMIISAIKVAPGNVKQTIKIPMPRPFGDDIEVCLFVKDLQRGIKVDHEKSLQHWQKVLQDAGVTRISKVMPLRELKAEYSVYEARRKLCDSYDLFLADAAVLRLLPLYLGKHFFKKHKQPAQVNMKAKSLVDEINAAIDTSYLHIYSTGPTSSVQVGRLSQSADDLLLNVSAAIGSLDWRFPCAKGGARRKGGATSSGGLSNIRSIHLKTDRSPSVPIYQNNVCSNRVRQPAAPVRPGDLRESVIGELSTSDVIADVIVKPDGDVIVVPKKKGDDDSDDSDFETEDVSTKEDGAVVESKEPKKLHGAEVTLVDAVGADSGDVEANILKDEVVKSKKRRGAEVKLDEVIEGERDGAVGGVSSDVGIVLLKDKVVVKSKKPRKCRGAEVKLGDSVEGEGDEAVGIVSSDVGVTRLKDEVVGKSKKLRKRRGAEVKLDDVDEEDDEAVGVVSSDVGATRLKDEAVVKTRKPRKRHGADVDEAVVVTSNDVQSVPKKRKKDVKVVEVDLAVNGKSHDDASVGLKSRKKKSTGKKRQIA